MRDLQLLLQWVTVLQLQPVQEACRLLAWQSQQRQLAVARPQAQAQALPYYHQYLCLTFLVLRFVMTHRCSCTTCGWCVCA